MTVLFPTHRTTGPIATDSRVAIRPATELTSMTRYRGGTYSHTVEKIIFIDGNWARTDLIRLNPNVPAYSLDFTGVSPRHPSRYQLGTWSELSHLRGFGQGGRGRLDPATLLSPAAHRRAEPSPARRRLSDRAGQHQRARSDRRDPGRDLVSDQRAGPGHPTAQRSGRRASRPRVGHHVRIRQRTSTRRLFGVFRV